MSGEPVTKAMKRNMIFLKDIATMHTVSAGDLPFDPSTIIGKDENVLTIDPMYAHDFINNLTAWSWVTAPPTNVLYPLRTRNRRDIEWHGVELQIVVGAILHTKTEMLLLQLDNPGYIVDRYQQGTHYGAGSCDSLTLRSE